MENNFKICKETWERLGDEKPYWSVLTNEDYINKNLDQEKEIKFFKTGKQAMNILHYICEANDVEIKKERCLDYGCGVGRVSFQLAKEFDFVLGVDISKNHIEIAKKKSEELAIKNVNFLVLEKKVEELETQSPFDVVFSVIVLQHIRKELVLDIFKTFIKIAKIGGYIIFQIPTHNHEQKLEQRKLKPKGKMEMHGIRQKEIFSFFYDRGCILEGCYERDNPNWLSYFFIFKKVS